MPTPTRYCLVAGRGEGETKLTAFDVALLDAGIGHLNLVKVSSVLPPGAEYSEHLVIPPGSLVPTAYGSLVSCEPGETISAAVGVGVTNGSHGVIMECTGTCPKKEIDEMVERMVEESLKARNMRVDLIRVKSVEHVVRKVGSVVAAVLLWY